MIRKDGFLVPAASASSINSLADVFRRSLGLPSSGRICVALAYDIAAYKMGGAFNYKVVEDRLMPNDMALTYPDDGEIWVSQSVFDGACNSVSRDRFTLAHELGHLLMHRGLPLHRAYTSQYKPYLNSEWQADEFGAAFLMPASAVDVNNSIESVANEFGVSASAAGIRINNLIRRGRR
ncbi:ImmA/IrrE family metallo-endopeptidase [Limnobacter sp.]|jgi:hypothetical protein|uniref:ImmA/IrrE family metallo-endopeptidase n=1 Tax=Limnobacter sp. TaxID=2003368 RepID=UPI0027BA72E9|nr:ImmA/IrrE family metallo-endopeptidase [Limnobacter sp.]